MTPVTMTPIEIVQKTMPRGNADWEGWAYVYSKLQQAANYLGSSKHTNGNDEHVYLMAAMVCGHEETMKSAMWNARNNKWI